jgi:hypothetical protein
MLKVKRAVFFLLAVAVMMPLMWLPLGAGEPYAYAAWTDFDDVAGHWGGDVMRAAHDAGIIEGYEGHLKPNDPVTGAQMAAMLARVLAADASSVGAGAKGPAAGDAIPPGAWYYSEATGARAMGFMPAGAQFDVPVTRAAAFEAILDAFQLPRARPYTVSLENYSDMFGYGADTRSVMASAVEAGIAAGYGGGLRASEDITRAEFLTAVFRAAPLHMDGAVIYGDADIENTSFASDVWFAADANNISLRDVAGGAAVIRSGRLRSLDLKGVSRFNRFVLASYGADIEIDMAHLTAKTVAIGDGSGAVRISGQAETVEIAGGGRSVTIAGGARRVVVSGDGNGVYISKGAAPEEVLIYGSGNRVTLESDAGAVELYGTGNSISGAGKAGNAMIHDLAFDMDSPPFKADRYIDRRDFGLDAAGPSLNAPESLPVGQELRAAFTIGRILEFECQVSWSYDGAPAGTELLKSGVLESSITRNYQYAQDMATKADISLRAYYVTRDGVVQTREFSASVNIENYSEEHYRSRDTDRVLALVTSPYKGDYTTQYAIDHDYQDFEKEIWINANGYRSDTPYLIWVNLATQHANVFKGGAGKWALERSCIVGTGKGNPTPLGVWKTTYKQPYGWTTGTYTVRPVVRFKGGGYAFHSRLYRPNTWTLSDPSIGFPVSHGCVRMLQEDIQWIYDTIPEGTTVVVF